ncbi:hypothetical protein [Fluviicola sp.]|uniref:hypothetical protein n=1 Tax=Fluviicola sp. TaxID=1917219 RepID=UPI0031DEBC9E
MNEPKTGHVPILDFVTIVSELIQIDLILQSNFHSTNSNEQTNEKTIQFKVRDSIFRLIVIKNEDIQLEAVKWYFQKIEEVYSIDLITNQDDLGKTSIEIMHGLEKFRVKAIKLNF